MWLDIPPELLQLILARDETHKLYKRDEGQTEAAIIASVIVGLLLCLSLATYYLLRHYRIRGSRPIHIPTRYLKSKWRSWDPGSQKWRPPSQLRQSVQSLNQIRSSSPANTLDRFRLSQGFDGGAYTSVGTSGVSSAEAQAAQPGIDRNTSVRSVMTLPAYSADARPSEKILGREGERAGMDMVVEFPETGDEEEARREEEMESLYQIRQARREEQATRRAVREERVLLRALIQEARLRGDSATVRRLREEDRGRRSGVSVTIASPQAQPSPEVLVQDHQSRDRGRRVSSVQYAALGLARHDGSRVRSDSASSDMMDRPLLDSAAAMGGGSRDGARSVSPLLPRPPRALRTVSSSSLGRMLASTSDLNLDDANEERPEDSLDLEHGAASHNGLSPRPSSQLTLNTANEPPNYDDLSPVQHRRRQNLSDPTNNTNGVEEEEEEEEDDAPPYTSPIRVKPPSLRAQIVISPASPVSPELEHDTSPGVGAPALGMGRLPSIRITPFSVFDDVDP